jgi:hypothetical protein
VWGVDDAGQAAIRATAASFVRVSPVNLMLSGLLRRLLTGERPAGSASAAAPWTPPPALGPLPALVDPTKRPAAEQAVLATLGTTVGGQPFVPGLYRMLATWPAFLAHVATVLKPHLDDAATRAACQRLLGRDRRRDRRGVRGAAAVATDAADPAGDRVQRCAGRARYVPQDEPEMVVFGRMLADALPA